MRNLYRLSGFSLLVVALISSLGLSRPQAETLSGPIESSTVWGSGWMDLAPPVDFQAQDILRLKIGGTAERVYIRLLPLTASPDSAVGIVGGAIEVPPSRTVEISIPQDRPQVKQISVHGGPNPWRKPLGANNGPATIEDPVERFRR